MLEKEAAIKETRNKWGTDGSVGKVVELSCGHEELSSVLHHMCENQATVAHINALNTHGLEADELQELPASKSIWTDEFEVEGDFVSKK